VDTRLKVVSLAAGRAGVRAGMTIAEARARCAALDVREWDEHAVQDAVLAATTALLAASPQVTPVHGAPGLWWVGASGFAALGGERKLAETLLHIARQWHPEARVAIADSCVAARAATWAPRTSTQPSVDAVCLPSGGCAAYLAPAPLGLLPMPDELREALTLLGLRTIGAFAALDAGDVEQRWGPEGLSAWRLAQGKDPRRPGLVRVEAARHASIELPAAVERAEPILFAVRAQLQRLLQECVHDGRAAAAVSITLVLDAGRSYPLEAIGSDMQDHTQVQETSDDNTHNASAWTSPQRPARVAEHIAEHHTPYHAPHHAGTRRERPRDLLAIPQRSITREVRPARPLARLEPLFDQCRALLERWNIPAPVIGVTLGIPATAPLAADQGDLLVPSWRDAAMNAEAVLARLRATLDPEHRGDVVVHPEARDTHRPEQTGAWVSADAIALAAAPLPAAPNTSTNTSTDTSKDTSPHTASPVPAVLRLLTPAEAIEVEAPRGVPQAIWWRGRRLHVVDVHGPERLSGDWWRGEHYARDYWRTVSDPDGELLIYQDSAAWYLHGWYD